MSTPSLLKNVATLGVQMRDMEDLNGGSNLLSLAITLLPRGRARQWKQNANPPLLGEERRHHWKNQTYCQRQMMCCYLQLYYWPEVSLYGPE